MENTGRAAVNLSLVIWILVAICLAWAVGAYSRLNRMREQVIRARASLLKYCKLYPPLMAQWQARMGVTSDGVVDASCSDGVSASMPLQNLSAAIAALQEPLAAWEAHPTGRTQDGALAAALDAIQTCVDALASAPEDLAGALWPADERGRWTELVADVRLRRSRYNVYASEMNEAVAQMPAALIARLSGIPMWGLL